jgi:hypothetical protein
VLHRIGQVNLFDLDFGARQRLPEEASGRSDKRPTLSIFHVARLFAHKHDAGTGRPLAKDRLVRGLEQIAPLTLLRILPRDNEQTAARLFVGVCG